MGKMDAGIVGFGGYSVGDVFQVVDLETIGFAVLPTHGNAQHQTAAPTGNIDIGDAAAAGSSASVARADHQHQFSAPGAGYPVDVDAGTEADGVATTPARSDHKHHVTVGVAPANVTKAAAAEGTNDALARADHKHDITTAAPTGNVDIGDSAAEGASVSVARADHQHQFSAPGAGYPVDVAATEAGGTATTPARSDHRHALGIMTTLGDILFETEAGGSQYGARLPGNTTTTKKFLRQTGDGAASAAPAWDTVADGDVPTTHSGSAHHNAVTIGADAEHSLATQVLSGVDASTTQKGHASFATADFTVASGAVSLKADGHGAAKHTNRTRSIWLPPRVFGAVVLTPSLVLFGPAAVDSAEAWAFDDTIQEGIGTTLILPADFAASGNVVFIIYWAADTDTVITNVCRWTIRMADLVVGDSINEAFGAAVAINTNVPSATAKILTTSSLSLGQANFSASSVARLTLIRNIASADDTMVGDALLLGVLVQYTADE